MILKIKTNLNKVNEGISKIDEVGEINVNGTDGNFSVKGVIGRFSFKEDSEILTISVDDKPWLATDSMIESAIKKFFN